MIRFLFRAALPSSALALAAAAGANTSDRAALTKALTEAERQWATYDSQATGCAFTSHVADVVQRREIALQRALGQANQPPVSVPPAKVAPTACDGPFHQAMASAAVLTTWDWLTRLDFHATFAAQGGWPRGIARIGRYVQADWSPLLVRLEESLVAANSRQVIDTRRESLQQEVVAVLMINCRERRPQATDCPELPAVLAGQKPAGRIRLAALETAASQLSGSAKHRDELDAVGRAWRLQKDIKDTSDRCVDGDRVIFPHARGAKRSILPRQVMVHLREWGLLTARNARNPDQLVTVEETDDGYVLLYSTELKVGFRDPVKRRFIACEPF